MKVLHIISSGGMYGAEAVILSLSNAMNQGPHRSIIAPFANQPHPNTQLYERATQEGIEAHTIPCRGQIDRSVPQAIRELALQTNADIIHAHGYKADIYVYLAMRDTRTPIVSTCHTWYDNDLAVRLYGALDRFVLRSYTRVAAVSPEVEQRLLDAHLRRDQVLIIRNGIDLRPFAAAHTAPQSGPSLPSPALKVGLVGRLAPEKGVDLFLRAAAMILSQAPLTQFLVVGDGPDRQKLQSLIDELRIKNNASLLGRRDNMPAFYASLDLMVSSSRQEGLPMALLEGMASGLPLIATNVGAVSSLVENGRTGILVPPNDVPTLSEAIAKLLREPATRNSYGAAARERIEKEFSAERMAQDYLHFYEEALKQAQA